MSKVTLSEAAQIAGVTKQAIRKAISAGKLTSEKNEQGHIIVQAGDIQRIWPRQPHTAVDSQKLALVPSDVAAGLQSKLDVAKAENRMLRERLDDLTAERDEWRENAKRAQLALLDQRPTKNVIVTPSPEQGEKLPQNPGEGRLTLWQWLGVAKR